MKALSLLKTFGFLIVFWGLAASAAPSVAILRQAPIATPSALKSTETASAAPSAVAATRTPAAAVQSADLLTGRQQQASFEAALQQMPREKADDLERLLSGIYFIDYGHAAPELIEMFLDRKPLSQVRFPHLYDLPQEPAFEAYLKAERYLKKLKNPLTVERVQEMHTFAVPWENSSGHGPGHFRQRFVYGPEFVHGLHPEQIKAINENPYLYFMPATDIDADIPKGVTEASLGDRIRGAIVYPRPRDIKHATLQRIRNSHPDLYKRVLEYQSQHGEEYGNRSEALTQELTAALLQERIETFEKQQAQLGPIDTPQKVDQYIRLIARFQKDYVSIHPFPDGNGRTSRLLLNYLAERKGLPAPRLVYPNEDLFWTAEMWEGQVREGMMATLQLKQDLLQRLKTRQPLEKSVALLTPVLPAGDLTAYEGYVRSELQSRPTLKTEITRDPVGSMRKLQKNYIYQPRTCNRIHRAG